MRRLILQRPGASSGWSSDDPIYIAGLFTTASGIGQSARACADALEACGLKVVRIDLSSDFEQADLVNPVDRDERPRTFSAQWGKPGGTLIVHFNGPELERALFLCRAWRGAGRRIIAAWVWELPTPPLSWAPAVRLVDELWVPSSFTLAAMRQICSKPIRVVPYYLGDLRSDLEFPEGGSNAGPGMRCVAFGDGRSSFERKNLLGTIKAFRRADLPEGSCLTIKTRNLAHSPDFRSLVEEAVGADDRIDVVDQSLPREQILQLLASHDVLISMHRAEGFGLALAEAMALGKVVVATGWSANMDFMDEFCSVPVPYELVPVVDRYNIYTGLEASMWADPDINFAAAALSKLAIDPSLRARLGITAKKRMRGLMSGEHYMQALKASSAKA